MRSAQVAAALLTITLAAFAWAAPATVPTAPAAKFSLNFKDVPLDGVLDYFSRTIGFEILKDGPIDARVTIMSKQPLTSEEALTMLTAALRTNGFTVSRDGRLLRIASRDKAKKSDIPVHFGNNPADVASTDELITQVVPIENVSATKLRDDLKPLIGPDADVTANEGSNSIIITDTSANIHRLVQIISDLDEHESTTSEIRIVQLRHASASNTAKLLETLFKSSPAGPQLSPQQIAQMGGQPQPPNSGGQGGASERHGQSITVAADDRTNTLFVMASAGTLKLVDRVLERLDTDRLSSAPAAGMRLFTLKYATAEATAKLINNLFKPPQNSGLLELIYGQQPSSDQDKKINVVAESDERTNTVVVTGPEEKLGDVDRLIHQLDTTPMVSQELRVMRLKHADAEVVAKLVEDTFEPQPAKSEEEDNHPGIILLSAVPQEAQIHGLKITVTSDERTNLLLVSAPTALLDSIEHVVQELDADPATEDTMFIYHLRNAQAQHLSYTLNVLFGNINTPNPNAQQNPQLQQLLQFQQNQLNPGDSGGSSDQSASDRTRPPLANRNKQGGQQGIAGLSPAINELTGKAFVVADPDTNSLLITTASKYQSQVRRIVDDLDKPVRQVLIKVLLAEVTHTNGDQFGLDFSILNERQTSNNLVLNSQTVVTSPTITSTTSGPNGTTSSTTGGSTTTNNYTANNQINGTSLGQNLGAAAAAAATPNGLVYSLLEHNVTATLQALETQGNLDVLSRPYILTSDNQEASIVVGEEDPFITDSRVETTGQLVNTINYRQIGVILDVTPHVNADGLVVMDIDPQVSQRQPGGVTLTQGVISPIFSTRSASAHVAVPDGATIVIGGMMQDQVTQTINKVPLLGDLPLIGLLFQNTNTQKAKTELLFFLTPHVVQLPEKLQAMSTDEEKGLKLTTQAVEPGAFQEHMRGMHRGGLPQTQPSEPSSPVESIPLGDAPDRPRP